MTTDPQDNAFPVFDSDGGASTAQIGLTKREYFAAMAMQGLLAADLDLQPGATAILSIERADALIAALNREGQADG